MRSEVAVALTDRDARALGTEGGERWPAGRFDTPYLRDALLDNGMLIETLETLETAAFWSTLATTYDAERSALAVALRDGQTEPLVLCHMSHAYRTGASLYFTVTARQQDDTIVQWTRAKSAAGDAIRETGATITMAPVAITVPGSSRRSVRSASRSCGRSRTASIRRGSSTQGC